MTRSLERNVGTTVEVISGNEITVNESHIGQTLYFNSATACTINIDNTPKLGTEVWIGNLQNGSVNIVKNGVTLQGLSQLQYPEGLIQLNKFEDGKWLSSEEPAIGSDSFSTTERIVATLSDTVDPDTDIFEKTLNDITETTSIRRNTKELVSVDGYFVDSTNGIAGTIPYVDSSGKEVTIQLAAEDLSLVITDVIPDELIVTARYTKTGVDLFILNPVDGANVTFDVPFNVEVDIASDVRTDWFFNGGSFVGSTTGTTGTVTIPAQAGEVTNQFTCIPPSSYSASSVQRPPKHDRTGDYIYSLRDLNQVVKIKKSDLSKSLMTIGATAKQRTLLQFGGSNLNMVSSFNGNNNLYFSYDEGSTWSGAVNTGANLRSIVETEGMLFVLTTNQTRIVVIEDPFTPVATNYNFTNGSTFVELTDFVLISSSPTQVELMATSLGYSASSWARVYKITVDLVGKTATWSLEHDAVNEVRNLYIMDKNPNTGTVIALGRGDGNPTADLTITTALRWNIDLLGSPTISYDLGLTKTSPVRATNPLLAWLSGNTWVAQLGTKEIAVSHDDGLTWILQFTSEAVFGVAGANSIFYGLEKDGTNVWFFSSSASGYSGQAEIGSRSAGTYELSAVNKDSGGDVLSTNIVKVNIS